MSTYKIICGDCLEVMRAMPDKSVDLVLTDPPLPDKYVTWAVMSDERQMMVYLFTPK